MASVKIVQPTTFLFGAPFVYDAATKTVGTINGMNSTWLAHLHSDQIFIARVEQALVDNEITTLIPLACSEPLAQSYFPDDIDAFNNVPFSWTSTSNNWVNMNPIWRRYYRYLPSDASSPIYVCLEFGLKGGNVPGSLTRVYPYYRIRLSAGFDNASGLTGVVTTRPITGGTEQVGSPIGTSGTQVGERVFYTNGEDFSFTLQCQLHYSQTNANHFGKKNGFVAPFGIPRSFVLLRARKYESGLDPLYEPSCLVPPVYGNVNQNNINSLTLEFGYVVTSGGFYTLDGLLTVGVRGLLDDPSMGADRPGRIVAEPFSYVRDGGVMYEASGVVRMTDPDRMQLNVFDSAMAVLGENKRIAILPAILTNMSTTEVHYGHINATVIGVILDGDLVIA